MVFFDFILKTGSTSIKKASALRVRKQMFQKLGELSYALYKAGKIEDKSVGSITKEIDKLNQEIKNHKLSSKY